MSYSGVAEGTQDHDRIVAMN